MMPACHIVPSTIIHTRHGTPSHVLRRRGLSVWVDLDRLDEAGRQARLFSVDRFNLLSLYQRDYGPNFRRRGGAGARGSGTDGIGAMGAVKEGAGAMGVGTDGTGGNGAGTDGIGENGVGKDRTGENEARKESASENGAGKDGTGKDGTGKDGTGERGGAGKGVFGNGASDNDGPVGLGDYARRLAGRICPDKEIASVHLLTFPRILGLVFNPVSIYVLRDGRGRDAVYIYEVRNTFGDMHSYVGPAGGAGAVLEADKILHVSPFFDTDGGYRLMFRNCGSTGELRVLMRYVRDGAPRLTATLRGRCEPLGDGAVIRGLVATRQWPLRPLVSIHFEALRLWLKGVVYKKRPQPPGPVSQARAVARTSRGGRT